MTKTLTIILNHNLPDLTNWLYYSLKKHQDNTFELLVVDNGSLDEFTPGYAHIKLEENLFWGGALNKAFEMVLSDSAYDSLLFLNNDIEINPAVFVQSLRRELFDNNYAIVSPCIAGKPQPWRQMQNWSSAQPRIVKWIDNQAPLFHRKIIEKIQQFPEELFMGWGQDMLCYDHCYENNWGIAVCDYISIIHYGKQTLLRNRLFRLNNKRTEHQLNDDYPTVWDLYKSEAIRTRNAYFSKNPLKYESFDRLVEYGLGYTYPEKK